MLGIILSFPVVREAQLLIEPAFFWFVIAGGTGLLILAVIRLIELFSKNKMLFERSEKAQRARKALKDLE